MSGEWVQFEEGVEPIEGRALIGGEVPYENRRAVIGQIDCGHWDIRE